MKKSLTDAFRAVRVQLKWANDPGSTGWRAVLRERPGAGLALGAGLPSWWRAPLARCAAAAGASPGAGDWFKALEASGLARGKIEFARELLTEADPLVERLESRQRRSEPRRLPRACVIALGGAQHIRGHRKGPAAHRSGPPVSAYYLPRAAEMAEAYRALEAARR
jgi:hypothetical protein